MYKRQVGVRREPTRLETDSDADASEAAPAETACSKPDAKTGARREISGRITVSVTGRLRRDATRNSKCESQDAE
jgi:hypothetical protein